MNQYGGSRFRKKWTYLGYEFGVVNRMYRTIVIFARRKSEGLPTLQLLVRAVGCIVVPTNKTQKCRHWQVRAEDRRNQDSYVMRADRY